MTGTIALIRKVDARFCCDFAGVSEAQCVFAMLCNPATICLHESRQEAAEGLKKGCARPKAK
jgi:hypothetical protein